MKKITAWLDAHLLTVLTAVLIVMIPLYPKIPLAELIQGYIVRLRLEDLLVLFTSFVWFVQFLRRKVSLPRNLLGKLIFVYLIAGLLSSLSALFILHTVPFEKAHMLKLGFHWFRRIEYFSLFFITYSAIRSQKDIKLFLKIALFTLAGVAIYGIGQKYLYWPAFSTMNREFSKGVKLYLQPNTRLFSTFGGHYDLAAYLTIALGFLVPGAWLAPKKWLKALLTILTILAYWCLVLTTSRTSFIGYLVGTTLIAALLIRLKGWWWSISHWLITMFLSLIIMFSFSNLLERFTQVIPNRQLREQILAVQTMVNQPFVHEPSDSQSISELPSLLAFLFKNEPLKTVEVSDAEKATLQNVASQSDLPPTPNRPTPTPSSNPDLPSDATQESEDIRKDTAEAAGRDYNGPSYSANALKYGLSMGIRLDVLWPQAIKGFLKNPILGSGYSTLVKGNVDEFTYAESTDNDYLRMLGETGLFGTLSFLAIIFFLVKYALALYRGTFTLPDLVGVGALAATVAILVTASYIDVFESSKVAYVFWMMMALVAYLYDHEQTHR